MAVDTQAKRQSVQAYTFGLMRPPPGGGLTEDGDRATLAWYYAGLDYGEPGYSRLGRLIMGLVFS